MTRIKDIQIDAQQKKLTRKQIWNMKRLWRMIPHVQCKGLCQAACTNVPIFPDEALYLINKYPKAAIKIGTHGPSRMPMPTLGLNAPCQFLKDGRCSIYDDRPSVCREYGHKVLTLDCGYDCRAKVPLSAQLSLDLMASHIAVLLLGTEQEEKLLSLIRHVKERGKALFLELAEQVDDLAVTVEFEIEKMGENEMEKREMKMGERLDA